MPRIVTLSKPLRRVVAIRDQRYVVTLHPDGDVAVLRWKGRRAVRTGILRALGCELDQLEFGFTRDVERRKGAPNGAAAEVPGR